MGQGTLWLPEHNVNREALNTQKDNEDIVIDSDYIMQVPENGVVLLKGALYPKAGTRAIVHRSPTSRRAVKNVCSWELIQMTT